MTTSNYRAAGSCSRSVLQVVKLSHSLLLQLGSVYGVEPDWAWTKLLGLLSSEQNQFVPAFPHELFINSTGAADQDAKPVELFQPDSRGAQNTITGDRYQMLGGNECEKSGRVADKVSAHSHINGMDLWIKALPVYLCAFIYIKGIHIDKELNKIVDMSVYLCALIYIKGVHNDKELNKIVDMSVYLCALIYIKGVHNDKELNKIVDMSVYLCALIYIKGVHNDKELNKIVDMSVYLCAFIYIKGIHIDKELNKIVDMSVYLCALIYIKGILNDKELNKASSSDHT
ncbi:hypothetical protein RRG08_061039 [Elysia crispata]|uniref:Uncharacterized protein n=1 Tax=Elysia crispata TaxID=231223 RepID=A0AAE1E536_9GAST|nr:hypothetical protein RRG08_061039 [Elysia crispata]